MEQVTPTQNLWYKNNYIRHEMKALTDTLKDPEPAPWPSLGRLLSRPRIEVEHERALYTTDID